MTAGCNHAPESFGNEISSGHRLWPVKGSTALIELISAAGNMATRDGPSFATSGLPSPPFLSIPGLPNFRDAGGYEVISDSPSIPSADGKRRVKIFRQGILFRSSEVGILSSWIPHFEVFREQELPNY